MIGLKSTGEKIQLEESFSEKNSKNLESSKKNEKNWIDTVNREVLNVSNNVGFCDVSTLGKIDIQGKDSLEFIDPFPSTG